MVDAKAWHYQMQLKKGAMDKGGHYKVEMKGGMEKGLHYDVEMKGWMGKGGIIMCNLKGRRDK